MPASAASHPIARDHIVRRRPARRGLRLTAPRPRTSLGRMGTGRLPGVVVLAWCFVAGAWMAPAAGAPAKKAPPNIVFILADDMGYGDPGCFNAESKIRTPHIDSLAAQ